MARSRATATLQGSVIGLVAGIVTDLLWQGGAAGWVSILAPIAMGLSARLLAGTVVDRMPLVTLAVALATYWFGVLLFPIGLAISGMGSAQGVDLGRVLVTLYVYTPAGLAFALPTLPGVTIAAIVHVTLIHRRATEPEPEAAPEPALDRGRRFRRRTVALTVVTAIAIGIGAGMLNSAGANQAPPASRSVNGTGSAG